MPGNKQYILISRECALADSYKSYVYNEERSFLRSWYIIQLHLYILSLSCLDWSFLFLEKFNFQLWTVSIWGNKKWKQTSQPYESTLWSTDCKLAWISVIQRSVSTHSFNSRLFWIQQSMTVLRLLVGDLFFVFEAQQKVSTMKRKETWKGLLHNDRNPSTTSSRLSLQFS